MGGLCLLHIAILCGSPLRLSRTASTMRASALTSAHSERAAQLSFSRAEPANVSQTCGDECDECDECDVEPSRGSQFRACSLITLPAVLLLLRAPGQWRVALSGAMASASVNAHSVAFRQFEPFS